MIRRPTGEDHRRVTQRRSARSILMMGGTESNCGISGVTRLVAFGFGIKESTGLATVLGFALAAGLSFAS